MKSIIYEEMQNFLMNYYSNVIDGTNVPILYLGMLRMKIGSINYTGEKKLGEAMVVIVLWSMIFAHFHNFSVLLNILPRILC